MIHMNMNSTYPQTRKENSSQNFNSRLSVMCSGTCPGSKRDSVERPESDTTENSSKKADIHEIAGNLR